MMRYRPGDAPAARQHHVEHDYGAHVAEYPTLFGWAGSRNRQAVDPVPAHWTWGILGSREPYGGNLFTHLNVQ